MTALNLAERNDIMYFVDGRLTQVVDEPSDVPESGRVELGAAVARFPVVVDLHRAPGKPVADDFLRVTVDAGLVHVHLVPGPRRPDRVFDHVRVGYRFGPAQEVSDGVLVRLPRVAVLARAEQHRVPRLPVRLGHLGRETHLTRPRPVDVDEEGHRIVDVDVETFGVEEIRFEHL